MVLKLSFVFLLKRFRGAEAGFDGGGDGAVATAAARWYCRCLR